MVGEHSSRVEGLKVTRFNFRNDFFCYFSFFSFFFFNFFSFFSFNYFLFFTLAYVLFGGLKATIRSDRIQFVIIILLLLYLIFSVFLQNNNNLNLNIFQENFIKFDNKSLISSFQFGFVFFYSGRCN